MYLVRVVRSALRFRPKAIHAFCAVSLVCGVLSSGLVSGFWFLASLSGCRFRIVGYVFVLLGWYLGSVLASALFTARRSLPLLLVTEVSLVGSLVLPRLSCSWFRCRSSSLRYYGMVWA